MIKSLLTSPTGLMSLVMMLAPTPQFESLLSRSTAGAPAGLLPLAQIYTERDTAYTFYITFCDGTRRYGVPAPFPSYEK